MTGTICDSKSDLCDIARYRLRPAEYQASRQGWH